MAVSDLKRKSVKSFFRSRGITAEDYLPKNCVTLSGCLIIQHKFLFSLKSYKWKVIGKNVWYLSKGPEDFVNRFINQTKRR